MTRVGTPQLRLLGPGLVLAGISAAVATGLAHALSAGWVLGMQFPATSPLMLAMVVGAVAGNIPTGGEAARPGTTFAAKRLLRLGVALLGFRLALGDLAGLGLGGMAAVGALVAGTIVVSIYLGRRLGVSPALTLLVATGFAVCGTSAAAAVKEVVGADEDDMARAVGLITVCGTVGVLVLPAVAAPLGLDGEQFGTFVGASVHDVGQVVAAASSVGEPATEPALVVKLTRVALLAPVVAGLTFTRPDRATTGPVGRTPPLVPLFVVGFLVAAAVRTIGVVPSGWLDVIVDANQVVLALAMVGLGAQVRVASVRSCGLRPVVLAVTVWAVILLGGYALAVTV